MRIIVGLGNPGSNYADTRHNAGFMVVDRLAFRWHLRMRFDGPILRSAGGEIAGCPVRLLQPQTFMNRSADALLGMPISPSELVAVHDDLDLPVGQIRLRRDGGAAGHRGVASLIDRFGAEFDRVRLGIGRPPQGIDAAEYVLRPFVGQEREEIVEAVERASDAVECLLQHGLERAMNRFNTRAPSNGVAAS